MTEMEFSFLTEMESHQLISTPDKNLRSKIDSILRSLENLTEKKARIEFEIKRQKKSLARKRAELKRVSRTNSAKISVSFETGIPILDDQIPEEVLTLQRLDSKLLQESSQALEE